MQRGARGLRRTGSVVRAFTLDGIVPHIAMCLKFMPIEAMVKAVSASNGIHWHSRGVRHVGSVVRTCILDGRGAVTI
jgi:hypothetical protein